MKINKLLLIIVLMNITTLVHAQVGINNTDPKSSLDVSGSPADATSIDGVLVPRLTADQLALKTGYGQDQNGTLVYVTAAPTSVLTGEFVQVDDIGFYVYTHDGTTGLWTTPSSQSLSASNGLNIDATSGDVKLGGNLTEDTVIQGVNINEGVLFQTQTDGTVSEYGSAWQHQFTSVNKQAQMAMGNPGFGDSWSVLMSDPGFNELVNVFVGDQSSAGGDPWLVNIGYNDLVTGAQAAVTLRKGDPADYFAQLRSSDDSGNDVSVNVAEGNRVSIGGSGAGTLLDAYQDTGYVGINNSIPEYVLDVNAGNNGTGSDGTRFTLAAPNVGLVHGLSTDATSLGMEGHIFGINQGDVYNNINRNFLFMGDVSPYTGSGSTEEGILAWWGGNDINSGFTNESVEFMMTSNAGSQHWRLYQSNINSYIQTSPGFLYGQLDSNDSNAFIGVIDNGQAAQMRWNEGSSTETNSLLVSQNGVTTDYLNIKEGVKLNIKTETLGAGGYTIDRKNDQVLQFTVSSPTSPVVTLPSAGGSLAEWGAHYIITHRGTLAGLDTPIQINAPGESIAFENYSDSFFYLSSGETVELIAESVGTYRVIRYDKVIANLSVTNSNPDVATYNEKNIVHVGGGTAPVSLTIDAKLASSVAGAAKYQEYTFKDITGNAGTNTITITPSATGGTIDGAANVVIDTDYGSVTIYTEDGTNFYTK